MPFSELIEWGEWFYLKQKEQQKRLKEAEAKTKAKRGRR